jgi:hypothetical protein
VAARQQRRTVEELTREAASAALHAPEGMGEPRKLIVAAWKPVGRRLPTTSVAHLQRNWTRAWSASAARAGGDGRLAVSRGGLNPVGSGCHQRRT